MYVCIYIIYICVCVCVCIYISIDIDIGLTPLTGSPPFCGTGARSRPGRGGAQDARRHLQDAPREAARGRSRRLGTRQPGCHIRQRFRKPGCAPPLIYIYIYTYIYIDIDIDIDIDI